MQGKVLELPGRQWRFESHVLWRLRTQRRLKRIRKAVTRQEAIAFVVFACVTGVVVNAIIFPWFDMEVLRVFCQSKLRNSLVLHIGNDILDQFVYLLKYGRLVSLRLTINRQFVDYSNGHLREGFEDALASNTTLETLEIGVRYPQESHTMIRSVLVALTKNPLPNVECLVDSLPHMHGLQELIAPWPVVSPDVDATDCHRLVTTTRCSASLTR